MPGKPADGWPENQMSIRPVRVLSPPLIQRGLRMHVDVREENSVRWAQSPFGPAGLAGGVLSLRARRPFLGQGLGELCRGLSCFLSRAAASVPTVWLRHNSSRTQ